MKVLHVTTLVAPDGAFGGPVRVAENQAVELRERGHDVVIAAGSQGFGADAPSTLNGTRLELFPARSIVPGTGFSGLAAPGMLRWLPRAIAGADVVHVHLARDLVTLPAAWLARRAHVPYVLQPHGMVVPSDHRLARPLDAALTKRVLADAGAVLYLTPEERDGLTQVGGPDLALEPLGNGVPIPAVVPDLPARIEVLYCSRLQARKRPLLFVEMAAELIDSGVEADFVLVGPDGGEGAEIEAAIGAVGRPDRLRWEGPLDPAKVVERIARASLLVLPSVHEPYPMVVLEAMSVGRPAVVTDTCGLAPALRAEDCGVVVDASPEALVGAVRTLLGDPGRLAALGARAATVARTQFSMGAVADGLERVYERAVDSGSPSRRS